ncbi:cytochrome P450 [Nocardioides marmoraquaticus]
MTTQDAGPGDRGVPDPVVDESRTTTLGTLSATIDTLLVGLDPHRGVLGKLTRGEFTRTRIGTRRFVVVTNVDHIDHVLHANRLNYVKSLEYEPIKAAAGLNLLTDEGESWAQHRGAVNPMFAKRRLHRLVALMVDPVEEMAEEMAEGLAGADGRSVVDIHEQMVQMTLRVVANALFSQDFGEVVERMHDLATRGLEATEVLLRIGLVGALPPRVWGLDPDVLLAGAGPAAVPRPAGGGRRPGRGRHRRA